MVEGPGATNNGKRMQTIIRSCQRNNNGRLILQNVRICPCRDQRAINKQNELIDKLLRKIVIETFSVGKEVFVIFAPKNRDTDESEQLNVSEIALRLHFGMNGTLKVGKSKSDLRSKLPPWQRNCSTGQGLESIETLEMELINEASPLDTYYVETRLSTYNFVSALVARSKFKRLSHLDVCGDNFNADAVIDKLKDKGENMNISDALLNQDIFPGVGNIIKIESLHRARINPNKQLNLICMNDLALLVKCCREFSMAWLRTKSSGKKNVYNRTDCGLCGSEVSLQRVGGIKGLPRTTFWCSSCQPYECSGIENKNDSQAILRRKEETFTFHCYVTCPQHGELRVKLRRCRKIHNYGRIFAMCTIKNCQYFRWADEHLPMCKCGQKVIMKMSKTSKTGGKWFLTCSKKEQVESGNSKGCKYFEWVTSPQKAPFGAKLTPLL